MKKIILFLILVIILGGLGFLGYTYFNMSEEDKYALKLNFLTENGLRKEISKSTYFEQNKEACELNEFDGFKSLSDCQKAVQCFADGISAIIPKDDLKQLAKDMAQGERAESAGLIYISKHKEVEGSLPALYNRCLSGVGYSDPD